MSPPKQCPQWPLCRTRDHMTKNLLITHLHISKLPLPWQLSKSLKRLMCFLLRSFAVTNVYKGPGFAIYILSPTKIECWPGPNRWIVLTEIYPTFVKPSIQIAGPKTFNTILDWWMFCKAAKLLGCTKHNIPVLKSGSTKQNTKVV